MSDGPVTELTTEKPMVVEPPKVGITETKSVQNLGKTMLIRINKDGDPDLVLEDLENMSVKRWSSTQGKMPGVQKFVVKDSPGVGMSQPQQEVVKSENENKISQAGQRVLERTTSFTPAEACQRNYKNTA